MATNIRHQGRLEKQGKTVKWQYTAYWFVLYDNELSYFKQEKRLSLSSAGTSSIDMSQAQTVRPRTDINRGYAFEINTNNRVHVMVSETSAERDTWITKLREAMVIKTKRSSLISQISSSPPISPRITGSDDDDEDMYARVTTNRAAPTPNGEYSYAVEKRRTLEVTRINDDGYADVITLEPEIPLPRANEHKQTKKEAVKSTTSSNLIQHKVSNNIDKSGSSTKTPSRNQADKSSTDCPVDRPPAPIPSQKLKLDITAASRNEDMSQKSQTSPVKPTIMSPKPKIPSKPGQKPGLQVSTSRPVAKSDSEMLGVKSPGPKSPIPNSPAPKVPSIVNTTNVNGAPTTQAQIRENKDDAENGTAESRRSLLRSSRSSRSRGSTETAPGIALSPSDTSLMDDDVFDEIKTNNNNVIKENFNTNNVKQTEYTHKVNPKNGTNGYNKDDLTRYLAQFKPNTAIPDLPYPRLELTFNEPFDHVRQFIARIRSDTDVYPTSKAMKSEEEIALSLRKLRAYLIRLDEIEEENKIMNRLDEMIANSAEMTTF